MLDNKQQSIKSLVKDFAANSSMHGLPKAAESKGNFRRFIWIILTLIGSGIALQHVAKIIILYNQWPLSTVVTIENNNRLDFPAVTICNMNPAKRSTLKLKVEELGFHDLVDLINTADERRKGEENSGEEEEVAEEEHDEENTADFYEALTAEYKIESAFISVIGAMNTTDRQMIGHSIEDMLIACTYEGRPCSARNFTSFYNFKYGNCYTFNGNPDITPRKLETKKPGPRYGLTMELYIQETEYSEFLADTLGAKILVHHQGSMPFPEDDGVSVSPGMSTSIGLSQVILERSKPPHGRCKTYTEEHNKEINVFAEFNNVSYSEKACMKTCYQKNVIKECKCCHFDFPCEGQALDEVLVDIKETPVRRCNETIDESCLDRVLKEFELEHLGCIDICVPSCSEIVFTTDISTGTWPSKPLITRTVNKVKNVYRKKNITTDIFDELEDTGDRLKFLRRNVVKVEMFYKQLNYERITATPAYDWSSLVSDLGGQAGLWIGFSILTAVEMLELLYEIAKLIGRKMFGTGRVEDIKKVNMVQVQPIESSDKC